MYQSIRFPGHVELLISFVLKSWSFLSNSNRVCVFTVIYLKNNIETSSVFSFH